MIRRFKRILLVARGHSEEAAAIARAVRLAKENGARLSVLRVLQTLPPDLHIAGDPPAGSLEKMAAEAAHRGLVKAMKPAEKQGVRASIKVTWGTPFVEVIREVLRQQHDLVMLNASSAGRLRAGLFGHMTMRLMRKCPCPIWVVKSAQRGPYERVLAALGPESDSKKAAALNQKILEMASSMAALEKSELHAVHAWDLFADAILHGRAGVPETELKRMAARTRTLRKKWLADLLSAYDAAGHPGRVHLLRGSPAVTIPRLVRRKKIDVLVMGTVCRTGMTGFLMGNTAEKILRQVDCSVLTLKPDGFVSPVKLK